MEEAVVIYDSENGTVFIILTGTVVFYGLVYCLIRRIGREQQKSLRKDRKGSDALMQHLLHKRCENPYCTHYFKSYLTIDEECRHCSYALIEMGLEEVVDMEDTQEAELQIKQGDINMALRYSDLLRQFLPGGLKHEEAIMLAMIERRNNGQFSWHPTGEYTLPVSEDNVILRNQRDRWRSETNR
jgi:hypothetical protein